MKSNRKATRTLKHNNFHRFAIDWWYIYVNLLPKRSKIGQRRDVFSRVFQWDALLVVCALIRHDRLNWPEVGFLQESRQKQDGYV